MATPTTDAADPATPSPAADPHPRQAASADAPPQHDPSDHPDAPKASKKTVWNRLSNGAADFGPVIDASAWPPLSESARASPKSSSSESLKSLADGSAPLPNPERASPSPVPQAKPDPANPIPARQRPVKRGPGNANGSVEVAGDNAQAAGERPAAGENRPREGSGRGGGGWEHGGKPGGFSQHGYGRGEHNRGFRKGGMHPNGYNMRHDHDRRVHDWGPHPNFGGRNGMMPPHQRPMMRPMYPGQMHGPMPFMGPPSPIRPMMAHFGYHDGSGSMVYYPMPAMHHDPLRGPIPYGNPNVMLVPVQEFPGTMPIPNAASEVRHASDVPSASRIQNASDSALDTPERQELANSIRNQINYYFSDPNLVKDLFLRSNMDREGWVPVKLVADFKKVQSLTKDIHFIVDSLRASQVVEVQGDKMRKRNGWANWLIPQPQSSHAVNIQSADMPLDNLAGRMSTVEIAEVPSGQTNKA